jgi:dienelactone hydrolase
MKWVKRVLWGLLGLVTVLVVLAGAGALYFWHIGSEMLALNTPHGGVEIREHGFIGRFYAKPGTMHHTAVLMLGGSNGGYPYDAAAQNLADSGYPTFGLAYFQDFAGRPKDLPKYLANIPLEYFFHALDWMKTRPEVNPDKIVLMGESRGGELVLLLASMRPDVAGVIAYSPSNYVWVGLNRTYDKPAWLLNGKPLPYLRPAPYRFGKPMLGMFQRGLADATPTQLAAAAIPVERIHAPILLISSKTDMLWPSADAANAVVARLKAHKFAHPVENLQFADSSHLLMGFGPGIVKFGIPYVWQMNFGGTKEGTRRARDTGWAAAKAFLAKIENGP